MLSFAIAACGGGDDNKNDQTASTTSQPASTDLTGITASNYAAVSANAYLAAQSVTGFGATSQGLLAGVTLDAAPGGAANQVTDLFLFAMSKPQPMVAGVSQARSCPSGGTLTMSSTAGNLNSTSMAMSSPFPQATAA